MAAYDEVLSELRRLRRSKAHVTMDFRLSPNLVWHTGRGNIDVTVKFLAALRNTDNREILAALASLGFYSHSSNIEERMNEFAAQYHEESTRTVRRWADEGFKKIAHLVSEWSEEAGYDRALVEILLQQIGPSTLQTVVTGSGLPDMMMLIPTIRVNYEKSPSQPINATPTGTSYFKWTVMTELDVSEPLAVTLEIEWLGKTTACYEVQVHPSIRDYVTASIVTKKGCEIRLIDVASFQASEDHKPMQSPSNGAIIE